MLFATKSHYLLFFLKWMLLLLQISYKRRGNCCGSSNHSLDLRVSASPPMAAAIGLYGPLIDLSRASSHVGDLVQLLVFVHGSQPAEVDTYRCAILQHGPWATAYLVWITWYVGGRSDILPHEEGRNVILIVDLNSAKVVASSRRSILMTKIQVGDDTRPYFLVYAWHKYIGTMIVPGDVVLLQNVKIVKFREVLEATTLQISLMTVLAHGSDLIASKDSDQLIAHLRLGSMVREKCSRVMYWIQHTESALLLIRKTDGGQRNTLQLLKNWKSAEGQMRNFLSIRDVLCLRNTCKVVFHAFIGEIFLSSCWRYDEAKEHLSLRKSLLEMDKTRITKDLICVGCTKCGFPLDCRFPLYCSNNSSYVHDIGQIYRPFLLHVWDYAGIIPLLVKNRAATILFGNITAEMVYKCYNQKSMNHTSNSSACDDSRRSGSNSKAGNGGRNKPNFYHIWFVLLEVLLKQQESPFQFEVNVDKEKDIENGRFELTLLRMPCYTRERPFIKSK